ncbi:MAG: OsmC family protein [Prevotellaceae bacterium]|jgi:uncharacterized OsmC-like protein|nr:OsmC family protein [Prevotellaceae bacterium]
MATAKTIYLGDLRSEITHLQSGEKIVTDAPTDNYGKGEFFSPTDMFAASLASCMLTIMGISAKAHGFDIDGTEVLTTKVMGSSPRRVVEIIVEMTFPHNSYSAKERRMLELAANECPVANSLHPDIKKTITFKFKE